MNCDECKYLRCFGQDGKWLLQNECIIAKCPLVIRDEALEEAAQLIEECKNDPTDANFWFFNYTALIRALKTKVELMSHPNPKLKRLLAEHKELLEYKDEVRNEALEEAAKVADTRVKCGGEFHPLRAEQIAKAIRALKTKGE